jgi:endonuclease/exonuclease/phosphatase family metal-dependent hydrolase
MLAVIREARPDIIGTQEGLYSQLRDLEAGLPEYRWIGLGRDGGSRGEFMAVYYRHSRFEPLEYDHYWLSDTPAVPGSMTWGNHYPRMVTSVRFRDRVAGTELLIVNTHLDHEVQLSRERSAALILGRLALVPDSVPIIITGDFNVPAGANVVYGTLVGAGRLRDSWLAPSAADTLGTFHGFDGVAAARGTLPPAYELRLVRDQSEFIRASMHAVQEHLIAGAVLAALVVFVFLWNGRSTMIAAIAIPTSIISSPRTASV